MAAQLLTDSRRQQRRSGVMVRAEWLPAAAGGQATRLRPARSAGEYASATADTEAANMSVVPMIAPLAVLALAALALPLATAHAKQPAAACAQAGTDDTLRPIPESLVPAVNAAFGTRMPTDVALRSTVFRCVNSHVLVCTTGANLPCGPANTSRTPGAGEVNWCRDHPDAAFIPMVATGHDTIYAWRCHGTAPQIVRQVQDVDTRGFIAPYWRELP
jgi:hypothetical protein